MQDLEDLLTERIYNIEEPPRRRWAYPRDNERNYVAACFHLISAFLTILSLIHLNWFRIFGNLCNPHLAVYQFLRLGYFGYFESNAHENTVKLSDGRFVTSSVTIGFHTGTEVLQCVTPEVLNLMRVLVMLSFVCIFCSMVGFCLDMIGPTKKSLRFVRRNGLPSTWAVLIIIAMVGVCYLVTNALEYAIQELYQNRRFHIAYGYGVYTITAAGAVSLLATACNLLQDPAVQVIETSPRERLVEEYDGLETFSVGMRNLPPPPPYTP
ncbi:transmembrane protein 127 [Halyomorpha halys]|uniref:transmembrane protein 127 n=1 Tax=Halyomorpha halys TaxID=286706 RepID=UPI0006D4CA4C|nr:transmembrane protein 127-like [Halyomorpha halys]